MPSHPAPLGTARRKLYGCSPGCLLMSLAVSVLLTIAKRPHPPRLAGHDGRLKTSKIVPASSPRRHRASGDTMVDPRVVPQ